MMKQKNKLVKNTKLNLPTWKAKTLQEKFALQIIKKLQEKGFKNTLIVGGYVRDMLLKRPPLTPPYKGGEYSGGEIDIATPASPKQVTTLLKKHKLIVIPTGLKHGTVTIHDTKAGNVEITTFRSEGKYADMRHPDSVKFIDDPGKDAARRDFTVNALFFDPVEKKIIDYISGLADLKQKKLKFIGSAKARIEEDALRLMRAVRFSAVLDLRLNPTDKKVIAKYAKHINKISVERVKQELDKIMISENAAEGIRLLLKLKLLKEILSAVEQLDKTPQSKNFHSEGNVFVHTLYAMSLLQSDAKLTTRYGLLFHDLGKAVTRKLVKKDGRPHTTFYNHQNKGVEIAKGIFKRLRFSNKDAQDIEWYIKNHHVPYEIKKMRKGKQAAWALDPRFPELLKIFRADSLAAIPTDKGGRKLKPSLESYDYAVKLWKRVQKNQSFSQSLITGNDVMKILKIKPGPKVGKVLGILREAQLSGKIKTKAEAIDYTKKLR